MENVRRSIYFRLIMSELSCLIEFCCHEVLTEDQLFFKQKREVKKQRTGKTLIHRSLIMSLT